MKYQRFIKASLKAAIVTCLVIIVSTHINAQSYTPQQTDLLDIKTDSMEVAGLTSLIEFCVKQDVKQYDAARAIFKDEHVVLNDVMKNGSSQNSQLATFFAYGIRMKSTALSVYESLYGDDLFKNDILAEKTEDRKKSVTWKEQQYKLTSDSKGKFKDLNGYLETAQDRLDKNKKGYAKVYGQ